MTQERVVKIAGLVIAAGAAVAALLIDGEPELTLFMAVTVVTSLAAFDAALDRQAGAFWPWIYVLTAILASAVPLVVSRLADQTGVDAARSAHVASVLFGGCLATAAIIVAVPPRGAEHRSRLAAILLLAPVIAGVAGASAAFSGAGRLGSERAARLLESLGWAGAVAIVVAVAVSVSTLRRPSQSFALFSLGLLGSALLIARRAAGRDDDLGWLAITFVLLALAPLLPRPAQLGRDEERRASVLPAIVSAILGVLTAQAAMVAVNDDQGWRPGAIVLAALSLAVLALGVPLYGWVHRSSDERDGSRALFEMIAGTQLDTPSDLSVELDVPLSDPWPETAASSAPDGRHAGKAFRHASGLEVADPPDDDPPAAPEAASVDTVDAVDGVDDVEEPAPHHVDPATGLLSAAGLQARLIDAFGRARQAGEVSILMVALRNLTEVEQDQGRVVSARTIAELAGRLKDPLPEASVARFATDAFAALIDGAPADGEVLVARCTDVLIDLLEPVRIDGHLVEIDVAAGFAQCYAGEDVAAFVTRANQGLERAVGSGEPTLVAMP